MDDAIMSRNIDGSFGNKCHNDLINYQENGNLEKIFIDATQKTIELMELRT